MTAPEFRDDVIRFARLSNGWPTVLAGYTLLVTNPAIAVRLTEPGNNWKVTRAAGGIVLLRRDDHAATHTPNRSASTAFAG